MDQSNKNNKLASSTSQESEGSASGTKQVSLAPQWAHIASKPSAKASSSPASNPSNNKQATTNNIQDKSERIGASTRETDRNIPGGNESIHRFPTSSTKPFNTQANSPFSSQSSKAVANVNSNNSSNLDASKISSVAAPKQEDVLASAEETSADDIPMKNNYIRYSQEELFMMKSTSGTANGIISLQPTMLPQVEVKPQTGYTQSAPSFSNIPNTNSSIPATPATATSFSNNANKGLFVPSRMKQASDVQDWRQRSSNSNENQDSQPTIASQPYRPPHLGSQSATVTQITVAPSAGVAPVTNESKPVASTNDEAQEKYTSLSNQVAQPPATVEAELTETSTKQILPEPSVPSEPTVPSTEEKAKSPEKQSTKSESKKQQAPPKGWNTVQKPAKSLSEIQAEETVSKSLQPPAPAPALVQEPKQVQQTEPSPKKATEAANSEKKSKQSVVSMIYAAPAPQPKAPQPSAWGNVAATATPAAITSQKAAAPVAGSNAAKPQKAKSIKEIQEEEERMKLEKAKTSNRTLTLAEKIASSSSISYSAVADAPKKVVASVQPTKTAPKKI